ncbi:SGNH/GDSL hydrolase family protein [Terrabacter sp. BE26]|uniref:SGNH/GDSL hydrolase family protein n=1 Tax=Terrabacter sp. BE26 TaxID=2898152 RepID=UPI0035BE4FF8
MLAVVVALVVLAALGVTGVVQGLAPAAPLVGAPVSTSALGGSAATSSTPPSTASSTTKSAPTGPLTLVGLGDSVPSAETCNCTGYVEQVGAQLKRLTHRPWTVHNDAVGGWTTADVENDVNTSPTRDHLANADLVLIEVGANDFALDRVADQGCFPAAGSSCWSPTLAGVRDGLTRIITAIRRIDHRPDLRIGVLGYWNVTRDGAVGRALGQAFVLGSDSLTRLVNDTLQQVALATGARYVDAYTPLKGESGTRDPTEDLLDDGDHPNASGHTLLARAVLDELATADSVKGWQAAP